MKTQVKIEVKVEKKNLEPLNVNRNLTMAGGLGLETGDKKTIKFFEIF